jgi:exodeoxyribonuclease V gamma subunit
VPARIVCLIGMNDGVFPRNPPSPGFDLIHSHPRPGDRQPRHDDRYALLQALLATRERFYVSYTGRDIRDDALLPPAAPVDELLDAVCRAFGTAALQQVVTEHPLQPFSPRYRAANTRLFTYAEVGTVVPQSPSPFLAAPLQPDSQPASEEALQEWLHITPDELIRFLQHPVRFLLRRRLGIELRESEAQIEANEPFLIDPREHWRFDQVIFDDLLGGATFATSLRLAQARGALPHGAAGVAVFTTHWPVLEQLAAKVAMARYGEPMPPPALDFSAHGVRLSGRLDGVFENGIVLARPGKQRVQEVLDLWVRHLLLNLAAPPGCVCRSRLLTLDDDISLRPLATTEPLGVLLGIYRRGLCELLPLPPKTAWKYAQAVHKGNGSAAWLVEWQGSEFKYGESQDAWLDLAFRDVDLFAGELGESFHQLAMQIFAPVLEASA